MICRHRRTRPRVLLTGSHHRPGARLGGRHHLHGEQRRTASDRPKVAHHRPGHLQPVADTAAVTGGQSVVPRH